MPDTIADLLNHAKGVLSIENARLDSEVLLASLMEKDRSYFYAFSDSVVEPALADQFRDCLVSLESGVPLAYILGKKEFWSMDLIVNDATLIPRPETEVLVDFILGQFSESMLLDVLDAGTGSGAIALALATERPDWSVTAMDYSAEALKVTQKNVCLHKRHVPLFQGDWLASIADQSLDILISNPPYIDAKDVHLEALTHEPQTALVAAENGLADIRTLANDARRVLKLGGLFMVEHGYDQGALVRDVFSQAGFVGAFTERDFSGNDRFTYAVAT